MDMVFPLNIMDATDEDYHLGKISLLRNAMLRPQVVFDKAHGYVLVVYESPSINIMTNQIEYFNDYLESLGDRTMAQFSSILKNWKSLWVCKNFLNITGNIKIEDKFFNEIADEEYPTQFTETIQDLLDYRDNSQNNGKPKVSKLKKLYYIERSCKYSGNSMLSNVFIMGYSIKLLE